MNIQRARSGLLISFIGFLVLTAVIGIATVLTGEFGSIQLKTLGTTFTISAASVCAMACAAFIQKRRAPALGWVGIGLNFIAAALVIYGMWTESGGNLYWKTTFSLIVLGLGFAHALLLQLPRLSESLDWAQGVAAGLIGLLALMIITLICFEIDSSAYFRLLGVASIVVVLFTLVIPVLAKLGQAPRKPAPTAAPDPNKLLLTPLDGDYYEDVRGVVYRVEKVPTAKGE